MKKFIIGVIVILASIVGCNTAKAQISLLIASGVDIISCNKYSLN
jgi:hypothetical protein